MLGVLDQRIRLLALLEDSPAERVYYARDPGSGRDVCVRELAAEFFGDADSFEFFLIEYDQIRRLSDSALIKPLAVRRAPDGRVFVISEYSNGISLRIFLDLLAAEKMSCPPDLAVYVIGEILRALQTAHDLADEKTAEPLGLMHLDICPTSILLSVDGFVKLKGFDLARTRHRTALGDRPGRLAYLPPERVGGAPLDHRSDVFSVGVCLYELVTGCVPFFGRNTGQVRQLITTGAGDFSPLDRPHVPQGLRVIVRRAIAHEPGKRYPDCRSFLADLTTLSAGLRFSAQSPDLAQFLGQWAGSEWMRQPTEQSAAEPMILTTTSVRELQTEYGVSPPLPTPKSDIPVPEKTDTHPEPIAALARKGGFDTGRQPPPTRIPPRKSPSRALWAALAAFFVLAVVVGAIIGLTPVGRFIGGYGPQGTEGVEIASVPEGAEIFINNEYAGRTPQLITEWPDGVTTIRLVYPGFAPADTILILEAGGPKELPIFILERKLAIHTHPANGEVIIDGVPVPTAAAAGYRLRAIDTISIEIRKAGFHAPPALVLAVDGSIGYVDPKRWQLEESDDEATLGVLGVFSRDITISSRPTGADVYIDDDTLAAGRTDQPIELTLGRHRVTLHRQSFMDYTFEIDVTEDSPERYTPMLGRFVRISAVSEDSGGEDIGAEIRWVRRGEQLIKGPDDNLQTPYSLNLEAVDHEVLLSRKEYRDTIVNLSGAISNLTVVMRPESRREEPPLRQEEEEQRPEPEEFRWVTFTVEKSGQPVSEAVVVGYNSDSGDQIEFGRTGGEGQLLVKVPPGEFSFVAIAGGVRSATEKEKIKPGRKIKTIRLKFR